MDIFTREVGQYHIIEVADKVDLYNIKEFRKIIYEAADGRYGHIAVELRGNTYEMDSSVISALISVQKKMEANRGTFVIINISEDIQSLLKLAGLSDYFKFCEDVEQLV
ncbi:MAG: STAS domain-containing protein [Spirochaetes bacterium]|jgi:anti-anti-sigma factor|nr:STAS domain-containing protein [Spirochaetota bacterium]